MSIELDCSDIVEIFKTHLKIDNSVKSIAHTFLNDRYASRIDSKISIKCWVTQEKMP